ncbi:MAG: CU044_2847 family protein [Methylococcales bacterium]
METTHGSVNVQLATQQVIQNFANLQDRIKAFSVYTLNSFKQIADVNVDKVTLEFDINVSGEAGIPYITKGSIGSNFKNYRGVFV